MRSISFLSFFQPSSQDWDEDIIGQQENTRNEMAVQSTYLTDIEGSIDEKTGRSLRNTRPIMCNTDYEGGPQGKHLRHMSQPERIPGVKGTPQLEPYWAAGFSFSRGHFVVNVPYDLYQPMIFQGRSHVSHLLIAFGAIFAVSLMSHHTNNTVSILFPSTIHRGGNVHWYQGFYDWI